MSNWKTIKWEDTLGASNAFKNVDGLQQSIKTSNDEIDSYNQLLAQAAAIDIDINS
jgi:hypothetical protein